MICLWGTWSKHRARAVLLPPPSQGRRARRAERRARRGDDRPGPAARAFRGTIGKMSRNVEIWTWDCGARLVDMDGDPRWLVPILETILDGGLWKQFRKFPADTLARLLPLLHVSNSTRRLLEIWVEETPHRAT